MAVSASVKEAWEVNSRVNGVLLEHLTPEMLNAQTPGGGYTVAQGLAHIFGTVQYWTHQFDEARVAALPDLDDLIEEENAVFDLERITNVKEKTEAAALEAAEAAKGEGELPHSSLDAYLVHMMVHDAHHRGQILLALKTAGHPLPDENLMWGPWRGG